MAPRVVQPRAPADADCVGVTGHYRLFTSDGIIFMPGFPHGSLQTTIQGLSSLLSPSLQSMSQEKSRTHRWLQPLQCAAQASFGFVLQSGLDLLLEDNSSDTSNTPRKFLQPLKGLQRDSKGLHRDPKGLHRDPKGLFFLAAVTALWVRDGKPCTAFLHFHRKSWTFL